MNSGFLLVNKPSGPTSHDIIDQLRNITGIKKIGHAGTLDPFASGLLIVGVGRESTRKLDQFLRLDKSYRATLKLGATTNTYDREGAVTATPDAPTGISEKQIEGVLHNFIGNIEQIPPMFSAKKVKGKKLYDLARQGKEVEREAVPVTVHELAIEHFSYPDAVLTCTVSSGTYIRSLAHDIGQELGVGAYLEELERTAIGKYNLSNAIITNDLTSSNWERFLLDL